MNIISKKFKIRLLSILGCFIIVSCEDFVEVDSPNYKMDSQTVFDKEETAKAAVKGIYNELFNSDFSNGYTNSISVLAGMSSDIFETTSVTDTRYGPFQQNEISPGQTPDATANFNLWSSAYRIIFMCNSALEGIENSQSISEATSEILEGQVRFVRAFTYLYLTNLYGDVPLILTTDYRRNATISRNSSARVFEQVITDLDMAISFLETVGDYENLERTNVNLYAALALRARVYLYQQQWEKAEKLSSLVINQTSTYEILENPDQVFLKNSREAIWQITPIPIGTFQFTYTWDGYFFRGNVNSPVKLSSNFISTMDSQDKRLLNWIGFNESREFYYPQKYKDSRSRGNITEYSMVLRLAEQYLIRAEAKAMQGKLVSAIEDIDVLRYRAGLGLISDSNPQIGKEPLLEAIRNERKRELFSEWGHRWFDLKRTEKAAEILAPIKPLWEDTDVLYPIPDEDRSKNPNLTQNIGY
ncbi:SusD/RagB family protein [Galbibacter marinus]|uniref:SusD/RagB family protein n=1 Tax=Galbibacter marinus TaxID=555500 RepID=K2PU26_9FLAO|nr:RagB/SusD family nutrient uptake outer membrane protein [Galbibacter marinus]EKF55079.1 SusD/RagB family protein [Galbibacter marinus]